MLETSLYPNHNHLFRRRSCLKVFIPLSPILFGWKNLNTWYYGVRFARNCHPDDLWSSYFTSSKYVKAFREEHGEPDVIEVRQTFPTDTLAREWEHKVLRRLDVIHNDKWLNKGTGKSIPSQFGRHDSDATRMKKSAALKGRVVSELTKEKLRNRIISSETRKKNGLAFLGKRHSDATKEIMSQKSSGENNPCYGLFGPMHPRGGKKNSDIHNQKVSRSKKILYQNPQNNPMYGRKNEINVFDIESKKGVRISIEVYNSNKNRYCTFNSKTYKEIK